MGLPGAVFAAIVDDHGIFPHPGQVVPGIFGVGVVDVQDTVAEVVFLGVCQQDLVPVHYGEQVLVRQPEGVDFFQSRPAEHVHGQIFPQRCQIQHHHAGVHIGRTCRDIQAAVIEPGQGLPDMGTGTGRAGGESFD